MVRLLEKKQRKRTVNLVTILAIATLSLHILTLVLLILQGFKIRQLYSRKPPTFVQLINGQKAGFIDKLERDPEVIRQFSSKIMTLMFNWSGKLPPQTIQEVSQPKPDRGITIKTAQGASKKVSTSSWMASFALSEDFRPGFLREIADMTPTEVFSNIPNKAMSTKLIIKRIYQPQKIAPGKWRVGIVANLIHTKTTDNNKIVTSFNKDLLIRTVDYFTYPQAESTTDLQKAIYSIRADRLEIYEIRDLCLLDEYNKLDTNQLQYCQNQSKSSRSTK